MCIYAYIHVHIGDRRPTGDFALWGPPDCAPLSSRWGLKIDKMAGQGSVWVGLLLEPFRPAACR